MLIEDGELVERRNYTQTLKNVKRFTTRHKLSQEVVRQVVDALISEVDENLVYDHFHPEVAGPLQFAIHYLQTRGT